MRNIKVSFVSDDISYRGGGERVTMNLTSEFKALGINSGIISYYQSSSVNNLDVTYLFDKPVNLKSNILSIVKRLRRFVVQNKIDYLIDTKFALSICSILATRGTSCQIMFQAHSNYYEARAWTAKLSLFLLKFFKCKIIVLTKRDKQSYIKDGFLEQNIYIVPNYIELENSYNYNKDSKKFLSVGVLHERKRFDLLIQIFYKFNSIFNDWTLDIYGDGPNYHQLKKLIASLKLENKVFLNGFSDQISEIMRSGYAAFLFASRAEAFPLVLLEALSNGLPVISMNCYTGPAEILDDTCGFLVENEKEFLEKMLCLARDEDIRVKMSESAVIRAKEFDKQRVLEKWSKILIGK